ncbi:piggyBac transposable element-derived protein 4-like [Phymastichus coffea]|uniref:piggyBac transposable element-derived protein 4-like n=1 Tax=Phymastichus coffea TaxID=108790 RepID=UPI00273BC9DE|nr:piggyBac transposable element-derived protein 4-like [Phymastichus coffea]
MGRKKNVVTTEIPSDFESVDGLQDSDNEEDVVNSRSLVDENVSTVNNNDDEEESMDAEDIDDSNQSDIWESVSRPRSDFMFSKSFGPNIPDTAKSPLDIFSCLFSSDLLDHIVHQINPYISQKMGKQDPITKEELKIFLGINILMGIKKLPSYRDYWSENPQVRDSYISSLMTVNRFSFFLPHIHVNDNSKEPKKGDPNDDKLYKVRPLLDELSRTFKESFNPGKHQSVDESI